MSILKQLWIIGLLLMAAEMVSSAAVLRVGAGETHSTIQDAINAASPGDTIEVAAGRYEENVIVNKAPLNLTGARAGADARGRIAGLPDPALESILAPPGGIAMKIISGAGAVAVAGFAIEGSAPAGLGVVLADTADLNSLVFRENHVTKVSGAGAALSLRVNCEDADIANCVFTASSADGQCVFLEGSKTFHGLRFLDNDVLRQGVPGGTGFLTNGDRNAGASASRLAKISGNRFSGHGTGLDAGGRSLDGVEIVGNTFVSNEAGGMIAGLRNSTVSGNTWTGNKVFGLCLTNGGNGSSPGHGTSGTIVEENLFSGNGDTVTATGYGDIVIEDQFGSTHETNAIRLNRFGSNAAVWNGEADVSVDLTYNYWNSVDGPGGLAAGSGGQLLNSAALADYRPFYSNDGLTNIDAAGRAVSGNVTLGGGQTLTDSTGILVIDNSTSLTAGEGSTVAADSLNLSAGAEFKVSRGEVFAGKLNLSAGAFIDVVDGSLSLDPLGSGEFHTIAGTFTFFNSLGSLNIQANTSFSGSTMCLVTDIHVADGVTLTVSGALVLDGCSLDSDGDFDVQIQDGADFEMTRCNVRDAAFTLDSDNVCLRDNVFSNSQVNVSNNVDGGKIFHNVFEDGAGALVVAAGGNIETDVEFWSNVTSAEDVENAVSLSFRPSSEPGRKLDAEGNLYVQPGDNVVTALEVSHLNARMQGVEVLLGFSSDYLERGTGDNMVHSAIWANGLYESFDPGGIVGSWNAAVGLAFTQPDPDGTLLDSVVSDLEMTVRNVEGKTRVFFRRAAPSDPPSPETRFTGSSGGVPFLREFPFTRNSGVLTVDGTIPVFGPAVTVEQTRGGSPVNVLQPGVYTHRGMVTVVVDVYDELAGIDSGDVSVRFTGTGATLTGVLTGVTPVNLGGDEYMRCVFEVSVPAGTPDGVYSVDASAVDRSGNVAAFTAGTIEIAAHEIAVLVEPQGLVTTAVTRNVDFTATDGGGVVLASWTVPVDFLGGTGGALLMEVPAQTANLSAKMAWNKRRRLAVSFDANGSAVNAFTGANQLFAGDFTGDNVVNLADYNVLRSLFPGFGTAADITGDGVVNLADYNYFRANWLSSGDPL